MPILQRIFGGKAGRRSASAGELSLDESILNPAGLSHLPSFGVAINNHSALNITALYAGIRLIAENVAALPKVIKKHTPNGWVDSPNHPVFRLIDHRPNPYTNKFDFWNCILTWLNGWGNAYAIIKWGPGGVPEALYQVHPSCVRVTVSDQGHKWYRVSVSDSRFTWLNGLYPDWQMLHFMLVTLDGIVGENPVVRNAMALGKSVATEKFASEFYEKGGQVKGVMETDGHLGDDEYNAFMKHFGNVGQNFDSPLLEYGIKYKQLSIDPVAAQLIQSETFSIQDIARILNLPVHLLNELSHATYSNIEEQNIQFAQLTLRPTVKRLEVEIESKLFVGKEAGKYGVKFSLDGLLRGNTQVRADYLQKAITSGFMSPNEAREVEGMERKEGLDYYLRPLNSEKVGAAGNNANKE